MNSENLFAIISRNLFRVRINNNNILVQNKTYQISSPGRRGNSNVRFFRHSEYTHNEGCTGLKNIKTFKFPLGKPISKYLHLFGNCWNILLTNRMVEGDAFRQRTPASVRRIFRRIRRAMNVTKLKRATLIPLIINRNAFIFAILNSKWFRLRSAMFSTSDNHSDD